MGYRRNIKALLNLPTLDEDFRGFLCKLDKEATETNEPKGQHKKENFRENVQTCLICKKPGHSTRNCFFKDSNNQAGTSSDKHHGWKTKECTYCKKRGHLKEDCWSLKSVKVHLLKRSEKNKILNFNILINNLPCQAYLDTGSELNVARCSLLDKFQNIVIEPSDIVVKGFWW
nr:unnamed protein product [Callosobruchus analis]